MFLLTVMGLYSSPAVAQQDLGFGLRSGFGLDPDQLVVGVRYGFIQEPEYVRIVPSLDLGVGGGHTTLAFNGDLLFRLLAEGSDLALYGGGGPTLGYASHDDHSSWDLGLSATAGVQLPILDDNVTNIEARFGVGDIPDFRVLFVLIL